MFDNLQDDSSSLFENEAEDLFPEESDDVESPAPLTRPSEKFLGMTAMQRFIIALMLMIATCTLGSICLLLTGKISLL